MKYQTNLSVRNPQTGLWHTESFELDEDEIADQDLSTERVMSIFEQIVGEMKGEDEIN
jgi:hypothetical protein